MIKLRSVDKAMKWVLQAEKDDRLVPSFGAEIVGEIEAHVAYAAELSNVISEQSVEMRVVQGELDEMREERWRLRDVVDKMAAELEKRGLHHSAIKVLRE